MATFKKVGVRCEGADCPRFDEMEIAVYPSDKEFSVFLASKGFVAATILIDGVSEKRMLCAECASKLNKVFK